MAEIFGHRHAALALLCVAEGPIRFGHLCAMMSEHGQEHYSDQKVARVLKVLHDLGVTTPAPGEDRGGVYRLTLAGRMKADRLAAAMESWSAFDREWSDTEDVAT